MSETPNHRRVRFDLRAYSSSFPPDQEPLRSLDEAFLAAWKMTPALYRYKRRFYALFTEEKNGKLVNDSNDLCLAQAPAFVGGLSLAGALF
jgi:hypothetical protein